MEYTKQQLTEQVLKQLDKIDWNHVDRRASGGTALYTIPVVVHVLHNYGAELAADSVIYKMIDGVNRCFLKTNADTAFIIDKFKAVAASTQIAFKLATKDPYGDATKGVEHIFTYLAYRESDLSKIHQWPPERYLNIWLTNNPPSSPSTYGFGGAYSPYYASYYPYYDGIIFFYQMPSLFHDYYGHDALYFADYLGLPRPCNNFSATCTDNDLIPDTPPCKSTGFNTCMNPYDTTCDTPNNQNIMSNFDSCGIMFTYGQGQYMQSVLELDFGNRDSLITAHTFLSTGMDQPMPDMKPVADFSVGAPYGGAIAPRHFYCQGQNVPFKNQSWRDTITAAAWTFSNNANIPASTSLTTVVNKFHDPGWVSVSLTVTGNNTGTDTLTDDHALFIADSTPTSAVGYTQEFEHGAGMDKWPMFNYYKNNFTWHLAYNGYFDNSSVAYRRYDDRPFPQNMTGTPHGDIDDIFTPIFDLSGFTDSCYLNFMSSGAVRAANTRFNRDSMEIDYSANKATSWSKLAVLKGSQLSNKGAVEAFYIPSSLSDWISHTISLPAAARTAHTIFRFRYLPGPDSSGFSCGNNFFIDNFNFSGFPVEVKTVDQYPLGILLLPNPTSDGTTVIIKDVSPFSGATIIVTDMAGKMVYETRCSSYGSATSIVIPARAIAAKGLYLVHVVTDRMNQTEKLVVY